jgi:hypothetical protein
MALLETPRTVDEPPGPLLQILPTPAQTPLAVAAVFAAVVVVELDPDEPDEQLASTPIESSKAVPTTALFQ